MRKLLFLLASAVCAHASIFPIASGTVSSGFGVSGTGGYQDDVVIQYALEQYDRDDVGLSNLQQHVYFKYSYVFAAGLDNTAEAFNNLVVELPENCAGDPECAFGIEAEGATFTTTGIDLYTADPAVSLYGIKLANLSPAVHVIAFSFFSNRIPGGEGRILVTGGDDYLVTDAGAVITPNQVVLPQGEDPVAAPEPMTLASFGSGLAAVILWRGRKTL